MVAAVPCPGRGKTGVGEWSRLCSFRPLKLGWRHCWGYIWGYICTTLPTPIVSKLETKRAIFEGLTPL